MAKIKQLSPYEAQKIAAGEVVERPANVVKELIENSLDAGATSISVYIEDAGKALIQVVDDGYGMSAEDARMSIRHHATSKITSIADLDTLKTFGFRGEALSSISSVSKLVLTTKESDTPAGITLDIQENTIQETIAACNTGTDIAIYDLFYNVPARRKFLKSKDTEWRAIMQLFHAFCLDYPSVHLKLYHDGKLVYNCPSVQHLTMRLTQLYEPLLAQSLVPVEAQEERMELTLRGAICDSRYTRYDRTHIFLFVNQRWIKSHKLAQAFIKGYQKMLPTDRYPVGFIFITLDLQFVDINIHPRKEEVQFLHPRIVEGFIEITVKKHLEAHSSQSLGHNSTTPAKELSPLHGLRPSTINTLAVKPLPEPSIAQKTEKKILDSVTHESNPKSVVQAEKQAFTAALDQHFSAQPSTTTLHIKEQPIASQKATIGSIDASPEKLSYKLIGQVLATYVIIETAQGMVMIDQHAAHERIIYERIRQNFDAMPQIKLLFPHVTTLLTNDILLITPYLPIFTQFGLVIEQISERELITTQTPVFLKNQPVDDIIKQVIGCLTEHEHIEKQEIQKIIQEHIHAQISCKAAVKAGDELTPASMHELIKDLYDTENKLTCPHHRPTVWVISQSELEKKFKRNYK
jgi:DNA mismatch repair protein MutL